MTDPNQTTGAESRRLLGRNKGARRTALRRDWREKKFKDQNGICAICGSRMLLECVKPELAVTLDHIIPLSRGGADHWENVQASHKRCNEAKGNQQ